MLLLLSTTQTTSNNVQEIIENKVEKRTKGMTGVCPTNSFHGQPNYKWQEASIGKDNLESL